MSSQPEGQVSPPPFTKTQEFWLTLAYAAGLGIFGAIFGLVFLGVINLGNVWYDDSDPDWFGGQLWWVAVTAGAGLIAGVLHRATRLPAKTAGLFDELKESIVDTRQVPGIVLVSAVSLIGGASLGPEKALGSATGGLGTWISKRRNVGDEMTHTNTLVGFAGAYGGLLSSPVISVMLILEAARPGGDRAGRVLIGAIVASSVSFGLYFAVAGSVFVDAYKIPQYAYEDWQLAAGLGLGLLAAVLALLMATMIAVVSRVFAALPVPTILRTTIGGAVFGLVGVALPLTLFTGTDQLETMLENAATLGIGLLVVTVFAKMFTFAVSSTSGFEGGPVFPSMCVGGMAGITLNEIFPGLPLGLTFTCMLAAVPGSLVSAPFSMVLLAAMLTQVGALQTAPILIAVVTAFIVFSAVTNLIKERQQRSVSKSA